jgi:hypothetical protein
MAGSYMTVSHCWGGEVPTTLTEKTMDFLKAGLVMQDLPKTFTDAVRIAASCGGLFHPRDSMDVQPIEVKATWACETADTYDHSESPPPGADLLGMSRACGL